MKLWKKIAIGFGGFIAFAVVFDVSGRLLFPEKWAEKDRQIEERRKARAEQREQEAKEKASEKGPSGAMYAGGLVAIDLAKSGAVKPSSAQVEALARKAAADGGISDQSKRRQYVEQWQQGFWVGWKSATR